MIEIDWNVPVSCILFSILLVVTPLIVMAERLLLHGLNRHLHKREGEELLALESEVTEEDRIQRRKKRKEDFLLELNHQKRLQISRDISLIKNSDKDNSCGDEVVTASISSEIAQPAEVSDQKTSEFLFIPNILNTILKNLEENDIKACRLVCKKWNTPGWINLSKLNNGNGPIVKLESVFDTDFDRENGRTVNLSTRKFKKSHQLSTTIKAAHQNWFKSVSLHSYCWFELAGLQSIFSDFGHRLTILIINNHCLNAQVLHQILTNYCPNLERLEFKNLRYLELEEESKMLDFKANKAIKLTDLCFDIDCKDLECEAEKMSLVIVSIIKISKLKRLRSKFSDTAGTLIYIFNLLQFDSEALCNLELLAFDCFNYDEFLDEDAHLVKLLNEIDFASQLKFLEITNLLEYQAHDLSMFLEKVNGSLERLTLTGVNQREYDITTDKDYPELELPKMDNLIELRYLANTRFPFKSINFLQKMPNLKIFYFGCQHQSYSFEYEREGFIDTIFSDCQLSTVNPFENLKELYLLGPVKIPSQTFRAMNTIFPNLEQLAVGVYFHTEDKSEVLEAVNGKADIDIYYEESFKGISNLKNLRKLSLNLNGKSGQRFKERHTFSHLKDLHKLQHLTIQADSMENIEKSLIKIPMLRRVSLFEVTMEPAVVKKLAKSLRDHDVQLEIYENTKVNQDTFGIFRDCSF